ncbi:calpain-8 [Pelobates cultripes]|uniref:Calpain-8 n=1 Tax=Pelobates cultripes TaxID=61616 RepID=A0AAD1R5A5_PELCU|nr:calpain-8 [Pelobates cultripes]
MCVCQHPPEVKENVPVESETYPGELENEVEELSAQTLNAKLNAIFKERTDVKSNGLCLDTCKRMVKLMDLDLTGTLSIKEYVALKEKLEFYTNIFSLVDTNLSGTIDSLEMGNALQNAGFFVNEKIRDLIVEKYSSENLSLDFDNFIASMIHLETIFKMFKILDKGNSGSINLSLSEWLCAALA